MLKNNFKVAAIQTVSSTSVSDNLEKAGDLINKAATAGAELIALPEFFCLIGRHNSDKVEIREALGRGPIQDFLQSQAQRHHIWLVGGTLPLVSPDADRIYNSCLVFNPEGQRVGRYDKIHLFGFEKEGESFDESLSIRPGDNAPQTFNAPCGRVGLSVCYDLRFPEFFRALGEVSLMIVPSAFTWTTGAAHWEILLRARAIENQCYVLAPAQGGEHENGRRTWGHSVLIDPWGDIVDDIAQGPGFIAGDIDQRRLADVRAALPALKHRTM
ncbi:MAG TPA: carbon-nitrogen hydrolase family protein [Paralcaligenes sp.]